MKPNYRCHWAKTELSIAYHDQEWGIPIHDDRTLFEFLILEGAQAGLSWETILRKRENYRRAFDNFEPRKVAKYQALSGRASDMGMSIVSGGMGKTELSAKETAPISQAACGFPAASMHQS